MNKEELDPLIDMIRANLDVNTNQDIQATNYGISLEAPDYDVYMNVSITAKGITIDDCLLDWDDLQMLRYRFKSKD